MMWWNGAANWWVWTVMILCMLAFWGLIAWVVVVVARSNKGTPSGRSDDFAGRGKSLLMTARTEALPWRR